MRVLSNPAKSICNEGLRREPPQTIIGESAWTAGILAEIRRGQIQKALNVKTHFAEKQHPVSKNK